MECGAFLVQFTYRTAEAARDTCVDSPILPALARLRTLRKLSKTIGTFEIPMQRFILQRLQWQAWLQKRHPRQRTFAFGLLDRPSAGASLLGVTERYPGGNIRQYRAK